MKEHNIYEYSRNLYDFEKNKGYDTYTMVSLCTSCGTIMVGKIEALEGSWEHLQERVRLLVKCPGCDSHFYPEEIYSVWEMGDPKKLKEKLIEQLKEKVRKHEDEKARKMIAKLDVAETEDKPANNPVALKISEDIPSLKSYIEKMLDLHTELCALENQIVELYCLDQALSRESYRVRISEAKRQNSSNKRRVTEKKNLEKKIAKLWEDFNATDWRKAVSAEKIAAPRKPRYLPENAPQKPVVPVYGKPGLFNKKKVLAENERLAEAYTRALKDYEAACVALEENKKKNAQRREAYAQKHAAYKEAVAEEARKLKEIAEKEIAAQVAAINEKIAQLDTPVIVLNIPKEMQKFVSWELKNCCNLYVALSADIRKLYAWNVIYPNYRDAFAMSYFHEYLNSGRCYKLQGPNGAYNLYEAERRSDVLASFIRTLEDVGKKQAYFYRKIDRMLTRLEPIKKAVEAMDEEQKSIKQSSDTKLNKAIKLIDQYCKERDICDAEMEQILKETIAFIGAETTDHEATPIQVRAKLKKKQPKFAKPKVVAAAESATPVQAQS